MLVGNISSKNNLTQQDPSDLSTSQSLKTYYFRDETSHRDQMSQAFGKLEFPELPPSCFRASSAPAHTCPFALAILAEPFHPSWLLIHHFRSTLRATGLLPLSDFLPHTSLQSPRYIPNKSCCGFPAYLSFSCVRYTSENFCPPAVGICAKLSSQQGETHTPVTSREGLWSWQGWH